MNIGIGLPLGIPGVTREQLLTWAIRADQSFFSSLAAIDRLIYANYEPLITLAAVASVTHRIELITSVLVLPTREVSLLAKQIASLDNFASGRLVLGIGVGNKEDDFQAAATPFKQRGKIMDQQLEQLKRIWSGEPVADGLGSIGPRPAQSSGPRLLFGGDSPATAQRISRWGEGFLSNQSPAAAPQAYKKIEEVWRTAGRVGKPRFVATMYFALGSDAFEKGPAYVSNYYSFRGPVAETIASSFPKTPDMLKERIRAYEDIGLDALILSPTTSNIDQLERLIDVLA